MSTHDNKKQPVNDTEKSKQDQHDKGKKKVKSPTTIKKPPVVSPTKPTKPPITTPPASTTPAPTGTTTPITHAFRGIIAFSGDNSATLANSPLVVGKHLNYAASEINPAKGQYRFDLIDKDITPWTAAGKKVILRISWSGWASWITPRATSWTPQWVYEEGVPYVTDTDGSRKPQYWHAAFLAALSDFATALAAHYDGDSSIVAIVIPVGDGSETKVDTRANSASSTPAILKEWQAIGYTDTLWWTTIQHICSIYQNAFKTTPLLLMPDSTFIGGTSGLNEHTIVNYAVSQTPPIWLCNNGLVPGQVQDAVWQKTTVLAEQRNKSAGPTELQGDLNTAMKNGASYILVFSQVVQNAGNASILQNQVGKIVKG